MADKNKLRNLIDDFKLNAGLLGQSGNAPCSIDQLRYVVTQLSELLNAFVNELDEDE